MLFCDGTLIMVIYLLGIRNDHLTESKYVRARHSMPYGGSDNNVILYIMHKAQGQTQVNHCNLYPLQEDYCDGLVSMSPLDT